MHYRGLVRALSVMVPLCIGSISTQVRAITGLKESLLSLTGGQHTKLVYVGTSYRLMAFDTDESSPRVLTQGVNQQRSLITHDGQQVLFNKNKNVCAINWDGSGERVIGPGKTADIWYDRTNKVEWVYCFIDWEVPLRRYRIDSPTVSEALCSGKGGADWLTVHQSGATYITNRTIFTIPGCSSINKGYGCWHSCSPDPLDPDRVLALQGGHQSVRLHPDDIYMAINPGTDEVWEVRWSNHKRFITYTSLRSCWVARLSTDLHRVEQMLQLTDADGSCSPKLWVDPGCDPELSIARQPSDVVAEDGKKSGFVVQTRTCGATFQWRRNGTPIPGATQNTLSFDSTAISDNGSRFSCVLSAGAKTLSSREATLTVYPDTTSPRVIDINPYGSSMTVMYSERVSSAAGNKASYSISPNVLVTGANPEVAVYRVSHNSSIAGRDTAVYTLTIKDVTDMSSRHNPLSPNPLVIQFTGKGIIDREPPSAPTDIVAMAVTTQSVALSWSESRDNIVIRGYQIFRNGAGAGTALNGLLSYNDTGLARNTSYEYTVKAIDEAGNMSAASTPLRVTTANPVYSLSSPKAGETYTVGGRLPIRYYVDRTKSLGELSIALSFNNGKRWVEILDQGFIPAKDTGTIWWTITDSLREFPTASTTCKAKIFDYAQAMDPYVTDGTFVIRRTASGVKGSVKQGLGEARVVRRTGGLDVLIPSEGHFQLRVYRIDGSRESVATFRSPGAYRLITPRAAPGPRLVEIFDSRDLKPGRRALVSGP